MTLSALLLVQSLTLGIGEHRTENAWHSDSDYWHVAEVVVHTAEVAGWKMGATMAFRHGLTSDHFPAWGLELTRRALGHPGSHTLQLGARAFTDSRPRAGLIADLRLNRRIYLHLSGMWSRRDLAATVRLDWRAWK